MSKNLFYDEYKIKDIKSLLSKKLYEDALKEIDNYKIMYPKDQLAYVYEAKALTGIKKYKEAENILINLLKENIKRKYVYNSAIMQLADVLKYQNNDIEAIKNYKKLLNNFNGIKESETAAYALIKAVNIYLYKNDYDNALNLINEYKIKSDKIIMKKAEVLQKMHNYEVSINILNNINDEKLYKNDVQCKYYLLAKNYMYTNNLEEAINCVNKCFANKNRYYWSAYVIYALIKGKLNKDEEAIEMCKEAIKQYNLIDAKDALIRLYIKVGLFDDANIMINEVWNECHDNSQKNRYLGKIALAKSDYIEAERQFTNAIQENKLKTNSDINYYLIIAKFRLKKYNEVLELINNFEYNKHLKQFLVHIGQDLKMIKSYINQDDTEYNYSISQLNNYEEEKAINHIIEKHYNKHEFNENIIKNEDDMIKLFQEIKCKLNKNSRIIRSFCDTYTVLYENISIINNCNNNFLEVICLPDTYNIITFYPSNKNKEVEEKHIVVNKQERPSQIDKFYKRYGKLR